MGHRTVLKFLLDTLHTKERQKRGLCVSGSLFLFSTVLYVSYTLVVHHELAVTKDRGTVETVTQYSDRNFVEWLRDVDVDKASYVALYEIHQTYVREFLSRWSPGATDHNRVFYNRVPKCGSSVTFKTISTNGRDYTNMSRIACKVFSPKYMASLSQKRLLKKLHSKPAPSCYSRHIYFLNFSQYGADLQPVYINLVRDPLEQAVSLYYWLRRRGHSAPYKRLTYDKCVRKKECIGQSKRHMFMKYFCGQSKGFCERANDQSYHRARHNVGQYYAVVGVYEQLIDFFFVLETAMPRLFRGLTRSYKVVNTKRYASIKKKKYLLNSTIAFMKPKYDSDYKLYGYISRRFNKQLMEAKKIHAIKKRIRQLNSSVFTDLDFPLGY